MDASAAANPPHVSRSDRGERAPLGRGATIALLVLLMAVVAGVVAYFNTKIAGFILDETVYKQSAVRYTAGLPDTLLHDPDARATSRLYSLLVSPFFGAMHGYEAVRAARAFNAFAFASTAIPVFLLARTALSRRWSLLTAALAITAPWLTLTTAMFAESIAFPLAMWSLLAMAWSWRRPGLLTDVLVLASIGLATVARVQFASLLVVYVIVVGWRLATVDRPALTRAGLLGALRTFPATALVIVLGVLYLIASAAGAGIGPSPDTVLGDSYASTTTDRATIPSNAGLAFAVQFLLLALGTGFLPILLALAWIPDALRSRLTREGPALLAVLTVAATAGTWGLVMYSQGGPLGEITEERYYFYVAPLVWICAIVGLRAGSVTTKRLLAWGAVLFGLALLLPLPQGTTQESSFFAPSSAGWTWLTGRFRAFLADATGLAGAGQLDLLALTVLVVVGLAALLLHLFGRRAFAWIVAIAVVLQTALTLINFAAINHRIDGWPGRTGDDQAAMGFVDRAVGDRPVTWIQNQPYDASWAAIQRSALFSNDAILQMAAFPQLRLTPVDFPMNSLPIEALYVRGDGRVVTDGPTVPHVTPYATQYLTSPFVQLAGRELARNDGLHLGVYDIGLRPRATWFATGLDPSARLAPDALLRYRTWRPLATLVAVSPAAARVTIRAKGRTRRVDLAAGKAKLIPLPGCTAPDGGTVRTSAPLAVSAVILGDGTCPAP